MLALRLGWVEWLAGWVRGFRRNVRGGASESVNEV